MEPSRDGAFRRGCRRSAGQESNVGIFASCATANTDRSILHVEGQRVQKSVEHIGQ